MFALVSLHLFLDLAQVLGVMFLVALTVCTDIFHYSSYSCCLPSLPLILVDSGGMALY
jgi:hypothetical protein